MGVLQILAKYLGLVEDLDMRLALSHKTGCRKIIIEVKSTNEFTSFIFLVQPLGATID